MKAGREHRVPLSSEALAVLKVMTSRKLPNNDRVFPGAQGGLISDVAINKTLHAIAAGVTAHGFRSSFRQWGAEATKFMPEALELALAHTNPNKVEASYQRSDLFDIRNIIMKSWAEYCDENDKIIRLHAV
jgi:integrase